MKTTRFRKLTVWLLALAVLVTFIPIFTLPVSAAEIEVYAEGTLGSSSKTAWTIYTNGLLVIDGKGNSIATRWDSTTASPWKDYKAVITRVSFTNCENWVRIPECTFRGLSNLKEVTLPENIEEICEYAFTGTAIETIILPESLKTIGRFAFGMCKSLNYININDGVTSIGSDAFSDCSTLKAVSIPDSVTSIGQNLFKNCTNLEYVRLSEKTVKVGGSMFFGCTMLKNVSLPASVTEIGSKAFSNALNLVGVYYHGTTEPTTYNPGLNNATFSLTPDTMVIYTSNDYSGTTMGLKKNWENDVHNVTKIDGHFVNIAYTANGAVKVGASIVPAGDTVTIDIMAYKNYELETITVTGSDGQVELSGSGHSRTFTMPEGDVTINATFKSTVTPHVHDWIYTANGATIKATCAYADTCHNPISKVEISKGNISSLGFSPGEARYMTVSGKMEDIEIPDLVYTLKSTGEVTTPINPGVYVASLTIKNVTATYEFEITRGNLNSTFFDYSAPQDLTYDGTPKYASVVLHEEYEPYVGEYTVYYKIGTTEPTEPINAGTYDVKVAVEESDYYSKNTGFTMGRQGRFTIAPKSIDDLTYEGLIASYPVGATPDVTIKYGDMTLVKDTDYTVEYTNNTAPGTATMTITGKGNYTGTKTLDYTIVEHTHEWTYTKENETTIKAICTAEGCPDTNGGTVTIGAPADLTYTGSAIEADVTDALVDTTAAVNVVYAPADKLTESKPVIPGTYTATITLGSASISVNYTIAPISLDDAEITLESDIFRYTGSSIEPTVTVMQGGRYLNAADDYTVTYRNNINIGTATVTVTGKGNYSGTASATFTIDKAIAPAITFPTASDAVYGDLLRDIALNGGSTEYGSFAWKDGSALPTVNNSGYDVVFTPSENTLMNYESVAVTEQNVAVSVAKKEVTVTADDKKICPDSAYTLTCTVEGFIGGDTFTAKPTLKVEGNTIKASGAQASENYSIRYMDGTLTIRAHKDDNRNHVCDYGCSVRIGVCEDKDKDHACDYGCTKVYGKHTDTNGDHVCEYGCADPVGACLDENRDHRCDYGCGNTVGACEDKNKDHLCDYGCPERFGICADKDHDHGCDYGCKKSYGKHRDDDRDGVCDYGCPKESLIGYAELLKEAAHEYVIKPIGEMMCGKVKKISDLIVGIFQKYFLD